MGEIYIGLITTLNGNKATVVVGAGMIITECIIPARLMPEGYLGPGDSVVVASFYDNKACILMRSDGEHS